MCSKQGAIGKQWQQQQERRTAREMGVAVMQCIHGRYFPRTQLAWLWPTYSREFLHLQFKVGRKQTTVKHKNGGMQYTTMEISTPPSEKKEGNENTGNNVQQHVLTSLEKKFRWQCSINWATAFYPARCRQAAAILPTLCQADREKGQTGKKSNSTNEKWTNCTEK